MNLFPESIRKLMLPCKIEIEKTQENINNNCININQAINNLFSSELNEENFSGSTCCENKQIEHLDIEDLSKRNIKNLYQNFFLLFII